MAQAFAVPLLVLQPLVIAFEQGDEEGEGEERVGAEREECRVVMGREGLAFRVLEPQPGRRLRADAVQEGVGLGGLPPGDGGARVVPVALDQLGVTVHGEEELVHQVLAHAAAPSDTR
ncbi:hypothetical protein SHKM778_43100 [Streptomyces sp. KM77-8]|uniref:Secreted protein n=1 Tax=Streptomyces haneummycinicus TaxID=3074435 RepID=A0AAT9HKH6_9ACTN